LQLRRNKDKAKGVKQRKAEKKHKEEIFQEEGVKKEVGISEGKLEDVQVVSGEEVVRKILKQVVGEKIGQLNKRKSYTAEEHTEILLDIAN
jgi:hypothetical protein